MRLLTFALMIVCFVGLVGCGNDQKDTQRTEFSRLFMHRPGSYSVMVLQGNQLVSINLNYNDNGTVTIIKDVPEGKPMWYSKVQNQFTVHIRSENDLEGGGFQNSKQPAQQTIPIK